MQLCKLFTIAFVFHLSFLSAQSIFDKGLSVYIEPSIMYSNTARLNEVLKNNINIGSGEGFNNIGVGNSISFEKRIIDSLRLGFSYGNINYQDQQFEKTIVSLSKSCVFWTISVYYLQKGNLKASLGIQTGRFSTSVGFLENTDSIYFNNNYPVLPINSKNRNCSSFSNKARSVGFEHRIEHIWHKNLPEKKKLVKFISFGIYNRLNYCFGSTRWTYNWIDAIHSKFTYKDVSASWQFQMGIYVRWHFGKREYS